VSKFKVGDRVRCVSATGSMSVGEIDTVFNADPHDGTMQLSKNGGWWFRQSAFELVPHPAESPDDWVTQDVVVRRDGVPSILRSGSRTNPTGSAYHLAVGTSGTAKDLAKVVRPQNPVIALELEHIAENLDRIAEILKPE